MYGLAARINVAELLANAVAASHPDRLAIVAGTARASYATLSVLTDRAGHVLRSLGCSPGDRVLLAVPDSLELVAAMLAAIKVGALAVPVSPGSSAADIAFYLQDTGARIALAAPDSLDSVLAARATTAVQVLAVGEPPPRMDVLGWEPAIASAPARLEAWLAPPDAAALVLYTSGSTGAQKAVVHSHRAMMAAARSVGADAFGLTASDRILSTARLSFAFGLGFGMTMPLLAGATTILSPTKDLRELARLIVEHRPTILCGVPSLLDVLLRASGAWLDLDLSSLRFIVSAGEPLPHTVYDGYQQRFGVEVLDGIGSTEMLTHFITNRPGRSRRGSCGTPVAGCDVRLVDDRGEPVEDGVIGNLRVNGETAFLGYLDRPEATSRVRSALGVATGDKLYRDRDGYYWYCGRADDMLKVAGMWLAPGEIEAVLRTHPDVEKCAVTTREDVGGRRRLVAYVVARPFATLHASDLYRYAGEQLADHMIPAAFVTIPALPLTPNGKLKRSALPAPVWTPV